MSLFKTIKVNGGLIGIWQITENPADLIPYFSPEELADEDFRKYSFGKRQTEWLATRLLLKQLIGVDFAISYASSGKPILNHKHYKHLSISHSRYFIAVFVHEQLPVGIDMEELSRNYTQVEQKYLSETELIAVNRNPVLQCLYWCAKEAIFKLVPDEGVDFRKQIRISPFNPELDDQFKAKFINERHENTYYLQFQTFSNHSLVWVAQNPMI